MRTRSTHHRQRAAEPPQDAPPESRYHIEHYGKSRYFAVYEGKDLLALTVYRKGAAAITARLEEQERAIAALQDQLAAIPQAPAPAPSPVAEPISAPAAWQPPKQLPLIAAEALAPYRVTSPRRRPAPMPRR